MTMAVESVFAIPELLEQILVYVDDQERRRGVHEGLRVFIVQQQEYYTDPIFNRISATKRVFRLQRVGRTFHNTINGSPGLKYRMGLGYKQNDTLMPVQYIWSFLRISISWSW